jgi:hypothetical protein
MYACWLMMADWFIRFPIIELVAAFSWGWLVLRPWKTAEMRQPDEATRAKIDHANSDVDERNLAATVILAQLNAVLTVGAIILAGLGAFVALGDAIKYPTSRHLEWSSLNAGMALFLALYTMGTLPTRTPRENLVLSAPVALLSAMAVFFAFAAGVRFIFATFAFIP